MLSAVPLGTRFKAEHISWHGIPVSLAIGTGFVVEEHRQRIGKTIVQPRYVLPIGRFRPDGSRPEIDHIDQVRPGFRLQQRMNLLCELARGQMPRNAEVIERVAVNKVVKLSRSPTCNSPLVRTQQVVHCVARVTNQSPNDCLVVRWQSHLSLHGDFDRRVQFSNDDAGIR